jgi:hypothetical protein
VAEPDKIQQTHRNSESKSRSANLPHRRQHSTRTRTSYGPLRPRKHRLFPRKPPLTGEVRTRGRRARQGQRRRRAASTPSSSAWRRSPLPSSRSPGRRPNPSPCRPSLPPLGVDRISRFSHREITQHFIIEFSYFIMRINMRILL